ncbi:MAG: hypothetical protein IKP28_03060 [Clostridia bacterium]|nr:hypothetical protein [Clostridia bacterium]
MEEEIRNTLKQYSQEHLLNFINEISEEKKEMLYTQIENIDFKQIDKLYLETKKDNNLVNNIIEPMAYTNKMKLSQEEKERYERMGDNIIKAGEYAVATMAGGQGTRLGHKRT